MKKFKLIICAVSLAVGLTSCDNYLDLQPESTLGIDQFYTNAVEAEIALAGIYSVFATDQLYGNNISIIMESGTDEGFYNRRFNEAWTVGLYRHTPSDNYVLTTWTSLYKIINLCNLFNEQLKKDIRLLNEKFQAELTACQQENEQLKKDLQLLKDLEMQLDKREKMLR